MWDGELYLEFCRGTYTSQAYTKKMNRKLEFAYRDCEMLSTLRAIREGAFDEKAFSDMYEGWKIILRNQFHDILPGSSIRRFMRIQRLSMKKAGATAEKHIGKAIAALTKSKKAG